MPYNLKLIRQINTKISVIGDWYFEGKKLNLQSLEDVDRGLSQNMPLEEVRKKKIQNLTAIPTGVYKLEIRHSPKYGQWMIGVKDVKGYGGILIHPLNKAEDTEGCLGVGEATSVNFIGNSRLAYRKLLNVLAPAMGFKTKNENKNWTRIIHDIKTPSKNEVILTIERNY